MPLVITGVFYFFLRDFTTTLVAAMLAPLGAVLLYAGAYLAVGGARHFFDGIQYAVLSFVGLALLAGAAATLFPALPGNVLALWTTGWSQLARRVDALEAAIEADDINLARKLASRGLGDPTARDSSGNPVLHFAKSAEMVDALLDAGLDPNAAEPEGRTLLMRTRDIEIARLLLEAGADPNARTRNGFTPLMTQGDAPAEMIEVLLEAGADVHAANDAGRTVADLVRGPGRGLLPRYAGGRPLVETGDVRPRGRDDWLGLGPGAEGRADASGVVLRDGPLQPGKTGRVSITIDNPTPKDRVLDIQARLSNGVLFVDASHDGEVQTGQRPGLTSTVRWPWLSLPAGARGGLEVEVFAWPDQVVSGVEAGGFSVDVTIVDLPGRAKQTLSLNQERSGGTARADWPLSAQFLTAFIPVALIASAWFVVVRRRWGESSVGRMNRIMRIAAGAIVLICVVLAGGLVTSIVEPYLRFEPTTCEVLDHRVVITQVAATSNRGRHSTGSTRPTLQAHPLAAVAMQVQGERRIMAGWNAGAGSRSVSELRAFPIDSTATCWVDPEDPTRFSLVRDPSIADLVGVALCVVVALPLGILLVWFGRGRRTAAQAGGTDQ